MPISYSIWRLLLRSSGLFLAEARRWFSWALRRKLNPIPPHQCIKICHIHRYTRVRAVNTAKCLILEKRPIASFAEKEKNELRRWTKAGDCSLILVLCKKRFWSKYIYSAVFTNVTWFRKWGFGTEENTRIGHSFQGPFKNNDDEIVNTVLTRLHQLHEILPGHISCRRTENTKRGEFNLAWWPFVDQVEVPRLFPYLLGSLASYGTLASAFVTAESASRESPRAIGDKVFGRGG